MKLSSMRILKDRAPPRLQSDSHLNILVPLRRSSRLQSSQRSVLISRILGSYYDLKAILSNDQRTLRLYNLLERPQTRVCQLRILSESRRQYLQEHSLKKSIMNRLGNGNSTHLSRPAPKDPQNALT